MSATRILGIALLVCGILGLAYGGFRYTRNSNEIDLGIVELQVPEQARVNIPFWLGIGLAVSRRVLLLVPSSRS